MLHSAAVSVVLAAAICLLPCQVCGKGYRNGYKPPRRSKAELQYNHEPLPLLAAAELPHTWDWCDRDGPDLCTPSWNQHEPVCESMQLQSIPLGVQFVLTILLLFGSLAWRTQRHLYNANLFACRLWGLLGTWITLHDPGGLTRHIIQQALHTVTHRQQSLDSARPLQKLWGRQ